MQLPRPTRMQKRTMVRRLLKTGMQIRKTVQSLRMMGWMPSSFPARCSLECAGSR